MICILLSEDFVLLGNGMGGFWEWCIAVGEGCGTLLGRVCEGVLWALGMLCSLLRVCLCGKVTQSCRIKYDSLL